MDNSLPQDLGKRLGELSELPAELKAQLQATKMDELGQQIYDSIKGLDRCANLDEILVALYRKTGKIHKRQYISNKLYRMSRNGGIESVKGKKSVYRIL